MNEIANSNQNVNNNNLSEALMENVQVVESTVAVMLDGSPMSQEAFLALEASHSFDLEGRPRNQREEVEGALSAWPPPSFLLCL